MIHFPFPADIAGPLPGFEPSLQHARRISMIQGRPAASKLRTGGPARRCKNAMKSKVTRFNAFIFWTFCSEVSPAQRGRRFVFRGRHASAKSWGLSLREGRRFAAGESLVRKLEPNVRLMPPVYCGGSRRRWKGAFELPCLAWAGRPCQPASATRQSPSARRAKA